MSADRLGARSGMYYAGARFYSADLGRFMSADSIVPGAGDPQALNRYAYVRGNPVNYVDPTGYACTVGGIVTPAPDSYPRSGRARITWGGGAYRCGAERFIVVVGELFRWNLGSPLAKNLLQFMGLPQINACFFTSECHTRPQTRYLTGREKNPENAPDNQIADTKIDVQSNFR